MGGYSDEREFSEGSLNSNENPLQEGGMEATGRPESLQSELTRDIGHSWRSHSEVMDPKPLGQRSVPTHRTHRTGQKLPPLSDLLFHVSHYLLPIASSNIFYNKFNHQHVTLKSDEMTFPLEKC